MNVTTQFLASFSIAQSFMSIMCRLQVIASPVLDSMAILLPCYHSDCPEIDFTSRTSAALFSDEF